jgi:diguanylate cyclase (GGDEF)-like protein
VDYFKKYNDGYGHIAGDECLRKVADSLKQTIKGTVSIAARYGGEEFVVILPATDSTAAEDIAKEIAQNIKQGNIPHEYSPLGMVSVSIGVASLLATVVKGRETQLVELADKALYNAKYSGRNRVVSSTCGM